MVALSSYFRTLTVRLRLVKVHMRKQHGAPPAQPRYGPIVVDDDEEEDEDGVGEDEDAE